MASGGLMTHLQDPRYLTMKSDKLAVQGTGITPRPTTPGHDMLLPSGLDNASSRASVTSDDATHSVDDEEANDMLHGVVTMNQVLEGQIEALRLRLQVEDKQHRKEKDKLLKDKDGVITGKESEIEDLKDSLVNRDERIQTLVKASEEKDRTIHTKVSEIEDLKKMVRQTEEYAHKLHRQIGRVSHEKQTLEGDTLYKEQNAEIAKLTEELVQLKRRLSDMEQELHRASKIIEEQSNKIKQLEEDRGSMHDKFRQELDKATKTMRQEVERMREVMRQNYDEMRQLRDQNRQMHSDVKDIKELLMKNRVPQSSSNSPRYVGTGVQRPLTASPINMFKPAEYSSRSPAPPRGSPNPRGPNQGVGAGRPRLGGGGGGGHNNARLSVDQLHPPPPTPSRGLTRAQQPQKSAKGPAVCTMKDVEPGSALPSIGGTSSPSGLQRTKSALRLSTGKGVRK